MSFSSKFKELRIDNDIEQKRIATLLRITVSAVSSYEQGLATPPLEKLIILADFFNISLDELVDRKFPKTKSASNNTEFIDSYNALNDEQQRAILELMKTM